MATKEMFFNVYAFTMSVESLDSIRVWRIYAKELFSAIEENFETRKHISGFDFVKVVVSHFATHLNVENEMKEGAPITTEEADKLSFIETEQIAEEIIKHHEYLFEDHVNPIRKELPLDRPGIHIDISYEKLDIPRIENESHSEYLLRLLREVKKREKLEEESYMKKMSQYSDNFFSSMDRNFDMIRKIDEAAKKITHIETIKNLDRSDFSLPDPLKANFMDHLYTSAPNPQHTTNKKLNEVIDVLSAQNQFLANQNEINSLTAQAITRLEVDAKDGSKKTTRYNIAFVVIGILALVVSLLSWYQTYKATIPPVVPPVVSPVEPSVAP